MKHFHCIFDQAVPEEICDQWVQTYDPLVVDGTTTMQEAQSIRRSKIHFVEDRAVQDHIRHFCEVANRNVFGVDTGNHIDCQFTRYDGDDNGFYDYHLDVSFEGQKPAFDRKISCTVLLNDFDEFEGGDFMLMDKKVELKKGSVILFPSFYPHKVAPVTKGTRYSMVGWLEGTRWR